MRVYDTAVTICREDGRDMDVVRLASFIHDADDRKLFGDNGYVYARRFMDSQGVLIDVRERVVGMISQITFKGTDSVVLETIEGMVVQDVDRMDVIGAIGIARAFAYRDNHGCAMHVPGEEPRADMDAEAYWSNRGTLVNHFYEKLLLLKDMMNTDTTKRMASAHQDYMVGFLDEFIAEWDWCRRSLQHKVVPPELNDPIALHPAEL